MQVTSAYDSTSIECPYSTKKAKKKKKTPLENKTQA